MVKIGLIAFANNSGLGAQTRRLAKMLQPEKILLVDASPFSENKEQNFDWYEGMNVTITHGFPSNPEIDKFLDGLTHVFTCENPFNFNLVYWGKQRGIKIFCQANYEFCENLSKPYLPIPDHFYMPSFWKIEDMQLHFGEDKVSYLPPPIDPAEFEKTRQVNIERLHDKNWKPRFLHIIGTAAHMDRNGTLDLLKAVKLAKSDFELVIRTQHMLPEEYELADPRVIYDLDSKPTNAELYENFDALLLPRRYGGLSLTTNEALMSGLPVFMPDIAPNDKLLQPEWLVSAKRVDFFPSRSLIAVYSVDAQAFADKIDWFAKMDNASRAYQAGKALGTAMKNFDVKVLKPQYDEIFKSV